MHAATTCTRHQDAVRRQWHSAAAPSSTSAGTKVRSTKSAVREAEVGSGRPWQSKIIGISKATLIRRQTTWLRVGLGVG